MAGAALKASFPPVWRADARLLILGSLPGELSLKRAQYYGHPQNQFWRLVGRVLGRDMPADYESRLGQLLDAHIALWDVVSTATRVGSLDAKIRDHRPNALADIVATLPQLQAVAFNGVTASAIGRRALGPQPGVTPVTLPSSSPAYTLAFERKAEAWLQLRRFLEA